MLKGNGNAGAAIELSGAANEIGGNKLLDAVNDSGTETSFDVTTSVTVGTKKTSEGTITMTRDYVDGYWEAEANPRWRLHRDMGGSGKAGIGFGPGGATAVDVKVWREDANRLKLNATFYADGALMCAGTKEFVQEHPADPSKEIHYAALEGGEAGTYVRGTGQLVNGEATIALPEHFALVTSESGLTATVTPQDECKGLWIARKSPSEIVVKELQHGTSNARFDFLVQGKRLGYEDFQVVRDK